MDKAIYRNGRRQGCGDLSDELDVLRLTQDGFLWIGLKDPTDEEFDLVNEELHLHPLAVEDAVNGHQRAKIEKYESSVFVVLKTLRYIEADERHRDRRGHALHRRPLRRHRPARRGQPPGRRAPAPRDRARAPRPRRR